MAARLTPFLPSLSGGIRRFCFEGPVLDHFRLARFKFSIRARETLILPEYKGSTLRGGLGHAFKGAVCIARHGECHRCLFLRQCAYPYVFETPPPEGTAMLRKYPAAPHPFVIEPPLDPRRVWEAGQEMSFGLVLIGRGIDYLPYFIYSFEELGRLGIGKAKGTYSLVQVAGEPDHGARDGWKAIYAGDRGVLADGFRIRTGAEAGNDHDHAHGHDHDHGPISRVTMQFLTPTRVKFDSHLDDTLEFHILLRNLLRRLSALSYFHCGQRLDLDFKGLIERAKCVAKVKSDLRWVDWERYSARQHTAMLMGGLVGSVTFEGPLGEFLPLLRLGEWVHVGKGTVFGLGLYRLNVSGSDEGRALS